MVNDGLGCDSRQNGNRVSRCPKRASGRAEATIRKANPTGLTEQSDAGRGESKDTLMSRHRERWEVRWTFWGVACSMDVAGSLRSLRRGMQSAVLT